MNGDLDRELAACIDDERAFIEELFGDELDGIVDRLGHRWFRIEVVANAVARFLGDEHATDWHYFCAEQHVARAER